MCFDPDAMFSFSLYKMDLAKIKKIMYLNLLNIPGVQDIFELEARREQRSWNAMTNLAIPMRKEPMGSELVKTGGIISW